MAVQRPYCKSQPSLFKFFNLELTASGKFLIRFYLWRYLQGISFHRKLSFFQKVLKKNTIFEAFPKIQTSCDSVNCHIWYVSYYLLTVCKVSRPLEYFLAIQRVKSVKKYHKIWFYAVDFQLWAVSQEKLRWLMTWIFLQVYIT